MAHFVGKLNFMALVNVEIAEVERDGEVKKCLLIPIKDNDLVQWRDEIQLWFRAFAWRSPKTRFSHFLMKFVPRSVIKRLSAEQLEIFANHSIGGMIKVDARGNEPKPELDTEASVNDNL